MRVFIAAVAAEPLDAALQQMTACQGHLTGLASAPTPDELLGLSAQQAATRKELAYDALQLIAVAKAAIDAGKPIDVLTSLVNEVNRLTDPTSGPSPGQCHRVQPGA
ncbi:hypothetical protein GCM10010252_73520 [Streptomyces aureoverticillatus]|nr:hypothetical protein GCM10010252_73520 [Streptomyces aureoverticillatus]